MRGMVGGQARWLSRRELAELMAVSPATVARHEHELPGFEVVKIGRQVRFIPVDTVREADQREEVRR